VDFIRLNLNGAIGSVAFLVVLFVAYFVVNKRMPDEYKRYSFYTLLALLGVFGFIMVFTLLTQVSVNQLPKNEIDRSYQTQSQDSYQNRVLENSAKGTK
jgi:hypothetical protein